MKSRTPSVTSTAFGPATSRASQVRVGVETWRGVGKKGIHLLAHSTFSCLSVFLTPLPSPFNLPSQRQRSLAARAAAGAPAGSRRTEPHVGVCQACHTIQHARVCRAGGRLRCAASMGGHDALSDRPCVAFPTFQARPLQEPHGPHAEHGPDALFLLDLPAGEEESTFNETALRLRPSPRATRQEDTMPSHTPATRLVLAPCSIAQSMLPRLAQGHRGSAGASGATEPH